MVDDEPVSRRLLEFYLRKGGFNPIVADNAASARTLVGKIGPEAVSCVVTDYNMPGESGLELLLWLRQADPTLAVVMVTATTERDTVAATLRGGAHDFLDKPISEPKLAAAVTAGVEATAQRRRLFESDRAVRHVSKTQYQMFGLNSECESHMDVCYLPIHAAGGDFVSYFPQQEGIFHVLAGDVSGHDLHAAFVSAYFQGMARGVIESGYSVTQLLGRFNGFLANEMGGASDNLSAGSLHSLCACIATVDLAGREVSFCNNGMPRPWMLSSSGALAPCNLVAGPPLGWFDDLVIERSTVSFAPGGSLYLWTDGLEDLAEAMNANPCSLAARLVRAQAGEAAPLGIGRAKDDVLVVRVHTGAVTTKSCWFPVLHETSHGGQGPEIDALQSRWTNSLELGLPDMAEDRRFDVLLATRELVLNAMKHGCNGSPDRACQLSIVFNSTERTLRVVVADPGEGHHFDWHPSQDDEALADLHRGLFLVNRLATRVSTQRHGAEVTLDFSY